MPPAGEGLSLLPVALPVALLRADQDGGKHARNPPDEGEKGDEENGTTSLVENGQRRQKNAEQGARKTHGFPGEGGV